MKRVSIFFIAIALIVGMIGCGQASPPPIYDLTIVSTVGGTVNTPGEGTFNYDGLTVVDLVATPDVGWSFDRWTGDVDTIDNVEDAETTITMNDNYSITAKFVAIYDLTISSITKGSTHSPPGSVTTPGEGTFTYEGGTVVNLVAEAQGGTGFIFWTGDVGTIADINDATTTITMNDNYSITANFWCRCSVNGED
jgi:preprotein translocase subunit YajC